MEAECHDISPKRTRSTESALLDEIQRDTSPYECFRTVPRAEAVGTEAPGET